MNSPNIFYVKTRGTKINNHHPYIKEYLRNGTKNRKKTTSNDYDTFQVNDEKITYMSLFDGLSCNQSFSQNKHKPKVKEKKSLDEI